MSFVGRRDIIIKIRAPLWPALLPFLGAGLGAGAFYGLTLNLPAEAQLSLLATHGAAAGAGAVLACLVGLALRGSLAPVGCAAAAGEAAESVGVLVTEEGMTAEAPASAGLESGLSAGETSAVSAEAAVEPGKEADLAVSEARETADGEVSGNSGELDVAAGRGAEGAHGEERAEGYPSGETGAALATAAELVNAGEGGERVQETVEIPAWQPEKPRYEGLKEKKNFLLSLAAMLEEIKQGESQAWEDVRGKAEAARLALREAAEVFGGLQEKLAAAESAVAELLQVTEQVRSEGREAALV